MAKKQSPETEVAALATDMLLLQATARADSRKYKRKLKALEAQLAHLTERVADLEESKGEPDVSLANAQRLAELAAGGSTGKSGSNRPRIPTEEYILGSDEARAALNSD